MSDRRRDPDQLLKDIKGSEYLASQGKLKIFFGASAGVGKTYTMLSVAHEQARSKKVLIGVINTHGRKDTEALVQGLPILPLKDVEYKGKVLEEFDIDAAMAAKPDLILIDELAHSNAPGSRHPKRWQDVEELLSVGIDVYSTLNVQHIETLNDVVSGITGIKVWETVPDHIFDTADDVVLIDLPFNELLQRLRDGKIYISEQIEKAAHNFFRKGNLIALRELALRRMADRLDDQMLKYRHEKAITDVWQTRELLLACVGPGEEADRVIRYAARIALRNEVPWHAVYVETPKLQRLPRQKRQNILKNLKLAEEMGAKTAVISEIDAVHALVHYAHEHNLSRVIIGRGWGSSWAFWRRSFLSRFSKAAPDLDLLQVSQGDEKKRFKAPTQIEITNPFYRIKNPWQTYAISLLTFSAAFITAWGLDSILSTANIAMIFLLNIVTISTCFGLGPSLLTSALSVLVFDFFFAPPRFSISMSDAQYGFTFFAMLVVGVVTSWLTFSLKYQIRISNRRAKRNYSLYEIARDLSSVLTVDQIAKISYGFADKEFQARSVILFKNAQNELEEVIFKSHANPSFDKSIAQWAFDHLSEAGLGTDSLPGAPMLYIPLFISTHARGVLILEPKDADWLLSPEQKRLLDKFARLIVIALSRMETL